MDADQALALRQLLARQTVAALATLHKGEPAVSMVPFALLPDGAGIAIHDSRLATHTKDMLEHPQVSLLVTGGPEDSDSPLSRPRVAISGDAQALAPDGEPHRQARAAYLARLPEAQELFGFADFSLFLITPRSLRYVGGFGRALGAPVERLRELLTPLA